MKKIFNTLDELESFFIKEKNFILNLMFHKIEEAVEKEFLGVHEFKPHSRGECFTQPFILSHPESILKDMPQLKNKFATQLKKYINVK